MNTLCFRKALGQIIPSPLLLFGAGILPVVEGSSA